MTPRARALAITASIVAPYLATAAHYASERVKSSRAHATRFATLADLGDRTYADMLSSGSSGNVSQLEAACRDALESDRPESVATYIAGRSSQGAEQLAWAAVPGTLVAMHPVVGIVREERRDAHALGFAGAWLAMLGTLPTRWSDRVHAAEAIEAPLTDVRYLAVASVEIALAPHETSPDTFASGEALIRVRVVAASTGNSLCEGQTIAAMPERVRVEAGGRSTAEAAGNLSLAGPSALTNAFATTIALAPMRALCGFVSAELCERVAAVAR